MLSLSTLKISTKLRRGLSVSTTLWKNKLTPKSNKPIDINDVEVSNLESAKLTPQQIKEITIVSPEERNIPNNLQPFYIPHLKFQIDQSQKNYETETNPIFKQVSKFRYNLLLFNYSNAEKNYKKYMRKEIERTNTAFFDPLSDKIVKLDPESGELVTVDQALHEAHLTVPPAFHNLPEESKLYVDSSDFYLKPVSTNINNQRLARATRILMFALPGLFNKMYFHQNSLLPRSSKIPDTFSLKIDKATNDFILVRSASKKINPELYAYDASGNMPLEASSDLAPAHPSKRVNFPAINQRPYGINLHGSFFNMGGAVGFVRVIQERRGRKPWVGPVWRVYDFWFPILAMSACIIYICLERDQWKEDDTYGVGPYLKRNPFKLIKDENVCCTDAMLEADGSNVKISPGQSEKLDPMARNSLTQAVQILINSDFLSGVKSDREFNILWQTISPHLKNDIVWSNGNPRFKIKGMIVGKENLKSKMKKNKQIRGIIRYCFSPEMNDFYEIVKYNPLNLHFKLPQRNMKHWHFARDYETDPVSYNQKIKEEKTKLIGPEYLKYHDIAFNRWFDTYLWYLWLNDHNLIPETNAGEGIMTFKHSPDSILIKQTDWKNMQQLNELAHDEKSLLYNYMYNGRSSARHDPNIGKKWHLNDAKMRPPNANEHITQSYQKGFIESMLWSLSHADLEGYNKLVGIDERNQAHEFISKMNQKSNPLDPVKQSIPLTQEKIGELKDEELNEKFVAKFNLDSGEYKVDAITGEISDLKRGQSVTTQQLLLHLEKDLLRFNDRLENYYEITLDPEDNKITGIYVIRGGYHPIHPIYNRIIISNPVTFNVIKYVYWGMQTIFYSTRDFMNENVWVHGFNVDMKGLPDEYTSPWFNAMTGMLYYYFGRWFDPFQENTADKIRSKQELDNTPVQKWKAD